MTEQRCEKKNHEDKKADFCDTFGRHSNSRKSKNSSDERNDEKSGCPLQHFASRKNIVAFCSEIHWECGLWLNPRQVQSPFRFTKNRVSRCISARCISL